MQVVKVPISSFDAGYRCRFCAEDVSSSARQCPNCGIPFPSQEAMGQRFIYRLLVAVIILGLAGWLLGFMRGSWVAQALGAMAGIAVGFIVVRWFSGHGEVRLRTHAFLRMNPEAMDWRASDIAKGVGTPATNVVSKALEEARRLRRRHE